MGLKNGQFLRDDSIKSFQKYIFIGENRTNRNGFQKILIEHLLDYLMVDNFVEKINMNRSCL